MFFLQLIKFFYYYLSLFLANQSLIMLKIGTKIEKFKFYNYNFFVALNFVKKQIKKNLKKNIAGLLKTDLLKRFFFNFKQQDN